MGKPTQPEHIRAGSYPDILAAAQSRYFILWDTEAKLGWLVDGCDVLLHLLRAQLKYTQDELPALKLMTAFDKLNEVTDDRHYAMCMLNEPANLEKPLYLDKFDKQSPQEPMERPKVLVQDRLTELLDVLLVLHSIQEPEGLALRALWSTKLFGWDFGELVVRQSDIYPKEEAMRRHGKAWAELAAELRATVLFGRNFGQLIEHQKGSARCSCWNNVHLASITWLRLMQLWAGFISQELPALTLLDHARCARNSLG